MPLRKRTLAAHWLRVDAQLYLSQESFHAGLVTVCGSRFGSHLEGPRSHRNCDGARHQAALLLRAAMAASSATLLFESKPVIRKTPPLGASACQATSAVVR